MELHRLVDRYKKKVFISYGNNGRDSSNFAPNIQQNLFSKNTLGKLMEFTGQLIMGGDLNIPMIPKEGTSSGVSSVTPSTQRGSPDNCRSENSGYMVPFSPRGKGLYLLFNPHKVYSHIDFYFIPHKQLHSVMEVSIGSITWSDHAPIFLKYNLMDSCCLGLTMWKLIENAFFQTNSSLECAPGVIWETHKAVIRGELIKHGARIKKEREEKLSMMLLNIHRLEVRHKHAPTIEIQ